MQNEPVYLERELFCFSGHSSLRAIESFAKIKMDFVFEMRIFHIIYCLLIEIN